MASGALGFFAAGAAGLTWAVLAVVDACGVVFAVGTVLEVATGGVMGACALGAGAGVWCAGAEVDAGTAEAGAAGMVVAATWGNGATATLVGGGTLAAAGVEAGWLRFSEPMLPSKVNWGGALLTLGSTCKALA